MSNDEWTGTIIGKSRGLFDGSNMYRRLKVRLADGKVLKVRVDRTLWDAINDGDAVTKRAGEKVTSA